jgi:NAD(P)-dependent dehydrogenase (short-subunit alcohol dehydrogenase family)/acyl dehydratase
MRPCPRPNLDARFCTMGDNADGYRDDPVEPDISVIIRLDDQDVSLFSLASHDRNPLHLSQGYARATPYGEPVAFGMLAVLAALGTLPPRCGQVLSRVAIDFRQPVFLGGDYQVEATHTSAAAAILRVLEGARAAMTMRLEFEACAAGRQPEPGAGIASHTEPLDRCIERIAVGLEVTGVYACDPEPLSELVARWQAAGRGVDAGQIAALLWSSYLVGMELPGQRAVYSRLDLRFAPDRKAQASPLEYRAGVTKVDPRIDQVSISVALAQQGHPYADGEIQAFVLRRSPSVCREALGQLLPRSGVLAGKVVLVTGGSRGLGAALCHALSIEGCRVILNYWQSREAAEGVAADVRAAGGAIELVEADVGNSAACLDIRRRVVEGYGGLDILVCNASPPIRPLDLGVGTAERLVEFVGRSTALTAVPLAALLDVLSDRAGWCVLVSSEYVRTVPAEYPHYVAAKAALEALVRAAGVHRPAVRVLIARPPRILTDQTNTALGRRHAIPVERVAARIVRRLCAGAGPQQIELLEDF